MKKIDGKKENKKPKKTIYTNIKKTKGADPANLSHQTVSIQRLILLQWRALSMFNV